MAKTGNDYDANYVVYAFTAANVYDCVSELYDWSSVPRLTVKELAYIGEAVRDGIYHGCNDFTDLVMAAVADVLKKRRKNKRPKELF